MTDFTIKNLLEVKDSAPEFQMDGALEARFAREDVGGEAVGVSLQRIKPNESVPFSHSHEHSEEIYVVLSGSGRVLLDGEAHDVGPLDAIRVAPTVARTFAAGPDGLEYVAFGQHTEGEESPMGKPDWPDAG